MKLDIDRVPSTILHAVDMLVESLSPADEKWISQQPNPASIHHTVGRSLRNAWSLWRPDTPLKRDAVESYGIAHADDISGMIVEWMWARVWEMPFDPHVRAQSYKEFWAEQGTTALEAGGWPPPTESS